MESIRKFDGAYSLSCYGHCMSPPPLHTLGLERLPLHQGAVYGFGRIRNRDETGYYVEETWGFHLCEASDWVRVGKDRTLRNS